MATSPSVMQAVQILRDRQNELSVLIGEATAEREQIADALTRLGVTDETADPERLTVHSTVVLKSASGLSVRATVENLLSEQPHSFTTPQIAELLGHEIQGDRSDEQFAAVIRTALYTLRNGGVVQSTNGTHVATKWVPTEPPSQTATVSDTDQDEVSTS